MSIVSRFYTIFTIVALMSALIMSLPLAANEQYCDMNCCPSACCEQAPSCDWSYNPPAHQKCGRNGCGGFLDNLTGRVDFLWWRPCSDGTRLGYTEEFSTSGPRSTTITSDTTHEKDLNFKFDPGFRLGLGYYCPSNCWDIALNWTHFHSKARAEGFGTPAITSTPGGFGVNETSLSDDFDVFISDWEHLNRFDPQEVKGRWSLDMDLVDLEFAQKYYVNHCFVIRPHAGLRVARIDQNYHVEQFAFAITNIGSVQSFSNPVKSKNDFEGIGPRVGVDLEFNLGCGFTLFGKGAASLVYGKFTRESREDVTETVTPVVFDPITQTTIETYISKGNEERCAVPMSDISIGLKWEHCLQCCNKYYPFTLVIAWEQNAFYNLNDFSFSSKERSGTAGAGISSNLGAPSGRSRPGNRDIMPKTGNLVTQGLTISAFIGF